MADVAGPKIVNDAELREVLEEIEVELARREGRAPQPGYRIFSCADHPDLLEKLRTAIRAAEGRAELRKRT